VSSSEAELIDRIIVRDDGCWDIKGKRGRPNFRGAYTLLSSAARGTHLAYKAVYEIFVGPAPVDRDLHHTCLNRGCVNFGHLLPITRSEHTALHLKLNPRRNHVVV
jgi:hypothetical protein